MYFYAYKPFINTIQKSLLTFFQISINIFLENSYAEIMKTDDGFVFILCAPPYKNKTHQYIFITVITYA